MTLRDTPSSGVLRVTLDLPDFWIGPDDDAEDVEVAMNLASDQVGAIFVAHDGDDPRTTPRTLVGTLVRIEVRAGLWTLLSIAGWAALGAVQLASGRWQPAFDGMAIGFFSSALSGWAAGVVR